MTIHKRKLVPIWIKEIEYTEIYKWIKIYANNDMLSSLEVYLMKYSFSSGIYYINPTGLILTKEVLILLLRYNIYTDVSLPIFRIKDGLDKIWATRLPLLVKYGYISANELTSDFIYNIYEEHRKKSIPYRYVRKFIVPNVDIHGYYSIKSKNSLQINFVQHIEQITEMTHIGGRFTNVYFVCHDKHVTLFNKIFGFMPEFTIEQSILNGMLDDKEKINIICDKHIIYEYIAIIKHKEEKDTITRLYNCSKFHDIVIECADNDDDC